MVGTVQGHRNPGVCSGLEMSPVLHGLMLSRDQTMQGDSEDGGAKHVVERLSRDAVTTEDSHHIQQTAARRQQVVYMISRTQSIIECNAQPTRSMFGHGGGGWDDWPHFPRLSALRMSEPF